LSRGERAITARSIDAASLTCSSCGCSAGLWFQGRERQKRNLLATLLLSHGTPMLLAGDEFGHSQGGNNNAYAQDNKTT
jgi:pullulanase/glycogen debranching enzyme